MNVLQRVFSVLVIGGSFCSSVLATTTTEAPRTFRAEIFVGSGSESGLYEGEVRLEGQTQIPHGFGVMNYFSGDRHHRLNYTGPWRDGRRHGEGGKTAFADGSVYEGGYSDGAEEGQGVIRYSNGNVLEGQFVEGRIHGRAVFRYPNGNRREGTFVRSVLQGEVLFHLASAGRTVKEEWRDGRRVSTEEEEEEEELSSGSGSVTEVVRGGGGGGEGRNPPRFFFSVAAASSSSSSPDEGGTSASSSSAAAEAAREEDRRRLRQIFDRVNRV